MLFVRVGLAAAPAFWGFALGIPASSGTPLLVGFGCTLVLFVLWWPGERFVEAVRRRVEPTGAAYLVDEVLRGRDLTT